MKRIGHLFDEICAFHSLEQAACRALRALGESGGALRFHFDLGAGAMKVPSETNGTKA